MLETIFSIIAVICYMICAFRIICVDSHHDHCNRIHAIVSAVLIAAFMAQSVNIIFLKDPVTVWDAFFALVLCAVVFGSKGNMANIMFRRMS